MLILTLVAHSLTAAARPMTLHRGSIELHPCRDSSAYCADVDRPLDPTGIVPGVVGVHFEYYPHTAAGKSAGTLVATEGGPGYPAALSRAEYLTLFRPLRAHRDVLIMDNRGTGFSGAVDCQALQSADSTTTDLIGACGRELGAHATLYSTAYAADDLAAILRNLGIDRIDLYGDSYGTYFEQIFGHRHPDSLRSMVLDGAYPLDGPDYAWYPNYAPAMRDKFNLACARFAPCARLGGASLARIGAVLQQLRRAGANGGSRTHVENLPVDPTLLAMVMFGSVPAYASVRDLDAAARAYLDGDQTPLLRLMRESTIGVDSRSADHDPKKWSAGLAVAVMCEDAPQIFDMRLQPVERAMQRDIVLTARRNAHPDTYAPFSIDEYRGMALDYSFIDQCVSWPAHPEPHLIEHESRNPDVPVLVISGELDNITPVADGRAVAQSFLQGRQVVIANSFHVNALPHARSGCGAQLVRHFFATRSLGESRCADAVPPLRLVPRFARRTADLDPVQALAGNRASLDERRIAAAALAAVGDVLARAGEDGIAGAGLRGGTFTQHVTATAIELKLQQVRFTQDLEVGGRVTQRIDDGHGVSTALHERGVSADLELSAAGTRLGPLRLRWSGVATARFQLSGTINGHVLLAHAPVP